MHQPGIEQRPLKMINGITTEFGLQTNRYERNHLRGRIGNGNARIQVETGSGSVRLRRI